MAVKLQWVVNSKRKTGARQPIVPSGYFKYLYQIGAGWENESTSLPTKTIKQKGKARSNKVHEAI